MTSMGQNWPQQKADWKILLLWTLFKRKNARFSFLPSLPVCKLRLNRAPSSCILTWQNNELSALNPFSRLWIMGTGLEVTRTDWVNWQSSCVLFSIASNPERSEAVGSNTQTSPLPVTLTRLPANGLDCVAITESMPIGKENKRTYSSEHRIPNWIETCPFQTLWNFRNAK